MLKNSVYNLVGGFLKLVINIIAVPILIDSLGIKGYGLFAIILSVINFGSLVENCISLTLTVFLSQKEYNLKLIKVTSFYVILILSLITALVFTFLSHFSNKLFDNLNQLELVQFKSAILVGIPIVIARFFHQFFIGIEQSYQQYKLSNTVSTVYTLIQVAGNVFVALFYSSIVDIFIWQAITSWVFVLIHAYICKKKKIYSIFEVSSNFKLDFVIFKKFWLFSYKAFLGTLGSVMFTQCDKLIVGKLLGTEIAGIYAALTSITYQINVISALPIQPIVPIISRFNDNKTEEHQKMISNSIRKALFLNFTIALGIGSFLIIFAPEIYSLILQKYSTDQFSLFSFYLLITIYSIYSLNAVGYFILYSIGKENINTFMSIFAGVLSLTIIFILSPKLGLLGACVGNGGFLITLILLSKAIKFTEFSKNVFWGIVTIPIIGFLLSLVSIFIRDSFTYRIVFSITLFILCFSIYFNKIKYYYYIIKSKK